VRQALIAGVIDELTLDIAPVLLGSGERIFDGVESFGFEPVEVLHSPLATHAAERDEPMRAVRCRCSMPSARRFLGDAKTEPCCALPERGGDLASVERLRATAADHLHHRREVIP
jgi:hypothetical protein